MRPLQGCCCEIEGTEDRTHTRLLPAMAALTGEVLPWPVVSTLAAVAAGGLSARAALSDRSIALPEPLCEDWEPARGL